MRGKHNQSETGKYKIFKMQELKYGKDKLISAQRV